MQSDLQLLKRYQMQADAFAFRDLVELHAGMVFATARRITRDASLAEDIAQETFLELARRPSTPKESVAAWLHQVARNRACNAIRAEARRRQREAAGAQELLPQAEVIWTDLEPLIDEVIAEMPDKLREPLLDHFLGGRSQTEVAKRLGVSQATVSRALEAGVAHLRTALRDRGVVAGAALASILLLHGPAVAPVSLFASLSKVGLAGIGTQVTATAFASTSWVKIAVVVAVSAALGLGAISLYRGKSSPSLAAGEAPPAKAQATPEVKDWEGRAFCPVCALPHTGGRSPEEGIFLHEEQGRSALYDLHLPLPEPQFHALYCVPSMRNTSAIHVRGVVGLRDGRPLLTVSQIERREAQSGTPLKSK